MKIFIASDHAGFDLKEKIKQHYNNLDLQDLGCFSNQAVDYPDYGHNLCKMITTESDKGILLCGSGIGMSIAANRHAHIRAALCVTDEMAIMARKHNNSNVLVLGARLIDEVTAYNIIDAFLTNKFDGGRHLLRLEKL
jgi:ribose 5-phosphate isomerase B